MDGKSLFIKTQATKTIRCRDDYHCGKALLRFEAMLKLESFSQYEYKNPQINPIENYKYKVSQHFISCRAPIERMYFSRNLFNTLREILLCYLM